MASAYMERLSDTMKRAASLAKTTLLVSALVLSFNAYSAQAGKVDISAETQGTSIATNLQLYGGTVWDIAVDPNDNKYVYATTMYSPNGFFRSANGGSSWSGLPSDSDHGSGLAVEVNAANGHVYALLSDLLVSKDHGETYEVAKGLDTMGASLLFAQNKLFVGNGNGDVMISANEGESFSKSTVSSGRTIRSLAASNDAIYALAYSYDTDTSLLFKSSNGGDSWSDLNIAASGITKPERVAVDPSNSNVFLVPSSEGGTTYRSSDGGSSWTALASAPVSGFISFDSAGRVYVGWNFSTDAGANWTAFGKGGSYSHLLVADPTNSDILYDTSTPGIIKSTDRGSSWQNRAEGISGVNVTSISQASDKSIAWAATQLGLAKTGNFLSPSPDWQFANTSFASSGHDSVWVKPDNPNIVVAGVSGTILRTTDGGATWSQATTDASLVGGQVPYQITSDSSGTLYAAQGPTIPSVPQQGGVVRSSDNGASWQSMSFPGNGPTRSIAVASDGDIFVGAHASLKGIYKYSGGSWAKLSAPDYEYRAIITDPDSPNTIYALASKWPPDSHMGFYKSTDDGASWQHITSGMGKISDFYEFNALAIQRSTSPNSLYLSGVTSGDLRGVIYKSSDGGENWGLYYAGKKGDTFHALLFDGLVAGNEQGIYSLKSRARLGLKAKPKAVRRGGNVTLQLSLSDAATKRKLKGRKVDVYKKSGRKWRKAKRGVKLNKRGRATVRLKVTRTSSLEARWRPGKKSDKAEYAKARSKKVNVRVRG